MKYAVTVGDQIRTVEIDQNDRVIVDGRSHQVDLKCIDSDSLFSLLLDNQSFEIFVERHGRDYQVMLNGEMHVVHVEDERLARLSRIGGRADKPMSKVVIKAPMPGLVVAVSAEAGRPVKAGQGLVILEAMKMENEIRAPRDGVVKSVRVSAGQVVEKDQVLVVIGHEVPR